MSVPPNLEIPENDGSFKIESYKYKLNVKLPKYVVRKHLKKGTLGTIQFELKEKEHGNDETRFLSEDVCFKFPEESEKSSKNARGSQYSPPVQLNELFCSQEIPEKDNASEHESSADESNKPLQLATPPFLRIEKNNKIISFNQHRPDPPLQDIHQDIGIDENESESSHENRLSSSSSDSGLDISIEATKEFKKPEFIMKEISVPFPQEIKSEPVNTISRSDLSTSLTNVLSNKNGYATRNLIEDDQSVPEPGRDLFPGYIFPYDKREVKKYNLEQTDGIQELNYYFCKNVDNQNLSSPKLSAISSRDKYGYIKDPKRPIIRKYQLFGVAPTICIDFLKIVKDNRYQSSDMDSWTTTNNRVDFYPLIPTKRDFFNFIDKDSSVEFLISNYITENFYVEEYFSYIFIPRQGDHWKLYMDGLGLANKKDSLYKNKFVPLKHFLNKIDRSQPSFLKLVELDKILPLCIIGRSVTRKGESEVNIFWNKSHWIMNSAEFEEFDQVDISDEYIDHPFGYFYLVKNNPINFKNVINEYLKKDSISFDDVQIGKSSLISILPNKSGNLATRAELLGTQSSLLRNRVVEPEYNSDDDALHYQRAPIMNDDFSSLNEYD